MFWPDGSALGYQPIIEGFALLAVSREFPDKRHLAGILRLGIAPLRGGADRLAEHRQLGQRAVRRSPATEVRL